MSKNAFYGMGSMGSGPIGAYHFDNLNLVASLAAKSAEVTHANKEAECGAIAVAIATALSAQTAHKGKNFKADFFIETVLQYLPDCDTKSKIAKSRTVAIDFHHESLAYILGNGSQMLCQDTVPIAIWAAAHHLYNFDESLWKGVSVLGDRDTICAIIGGITFMSSSDESKPKMWLESVEDFEQSIFRSKNQKP